jgi:hypothetical protein
VDFHWPPTVQKSKEKSSGSQLAREAIFSASLGAVLLSADGRNRSSTRLGCESTADTEHPSATWGRHSSQPGGVASPPKGGEENGEGKASD